MSDDYTIIHETPSVADYISLRACTGLTPKTERAASIGLANTLFAVQVVHSDHCASAGIEPETETDQTKINRTKCDDNNKNTTKIVGMGRIIGDNGCFFQIHDIAVLPAHQGKGLGKRIMQEMNVWMESNVTESGTVLLFADGWARELYKKFGFEETEGLKVRSVGMVRMF